MFGTILPMGDGMTGIARQDNRPPLYAVMTTIIAQVYTMKNNLRSFGHLLSSPRGKENKRNMSKLKENITLFRTRMKTMQKNSVKSKKSHTGESSG